MRINNLVAVVVVCLLTTGCQEGELEKANADLKKAQAELAQLRQLETPEQKDDSGRSTTPGKRLVHVVLFNLKDDSTAEKTDRRFCSCKV